MKTFPYYLGAPLWSLPEWKSNFYTKKAKAGEFLAEYATFFNAVEGNTTFYATPSEATVARWVEATPTTFRFSFKFPKAITHERKLYQVQEDTQAFLQRMQPLGERLNEFLVQLPASFGPEGLELLEQFLKSLPQEWQYAVEVRHPAFFTVAETRKRYNDLLQNLGVNRVILDSRPVHAAPPLDQATIEAHRKKPRLPVQLDVTANSPLLRYIGHPNVADNQPWLEPWAAQTARWLQAGLKPYIYLHTPSNVQVPQLARLFHGWVKARAPELDLPDLPLYPNEIPKN